MTNDSVIDVEVGMRVVMLDCWTVGLLDCWQIVYFGTTKNFCQGYYVVH